MTIILIGYMGSGKSTVGRELANTLKFGYVDLDAFIEKKEGKSISDLFKDRGEIYFRKIETLYLKEVIKLERTVVSLGGGTPCYGGNMQLITACPSAKSVYLRASIFTLKERLQNEKQNRPLIAHLTTDDELMEFIGKHLFERSLFYNQSDLTVVIDKKAINEIVDEIVKSLF